MKQNYLPLADIIGAASAHPRAGTMLDAANGVAACPSHDVMLNHLLVVLFLSLCYTIYFTFLFSERYDSAYIPNVGAERCLATYGKKPGRRRF
jgi:hypothetical protein